MITRLELKSCTTNLILSVSGVWVYNFHCFAYCCLYFHVLCRDASAMDMAILLYIVLS